MTTDNQSTLDGLEDDNEEPLPIGPAPTPDKVMQNFAACSRCSYFLSGYRVLHGPESLAEAAAQSDSQWLTLQWDGDTRHLVQNSFGCRVDVDWFYFASCCPECYRPFMMALEEAPESQPVFRLQLLHGR